MNRCTEQKERPPNLALDEGPQQDEDGNAGSHDEVDEVPEGQAAHFPLRHLLHLQIQPVPLVSQRALKANQHHLQRCGGEKGMRRGRAPAPECCRLAFVPR